MQITFEFDGLTVSAEPHYDRMLGYLLKEFHVSLNGVDFEGRLNTGYIKQLEQEALRRALEGGHQWCR